VNLTSLRNVPEGMYVRIVSLNCGRGARVRLLQMGLVPGAVVKVLNNSWGPLIIEVNGTLITIGKGLASKVLVEVLS